MARTSIEVIGAKQNNLRNINVEIPRDKLTVITGVSGSGKSSLAFDVIYGEAQRRFLESISNFAKSRINQVKKPKVDFVRGLSPVVAIEQKKGNSNPRSTVGTVTDIADYLRLLYATAGVGECPVCGHQLHPTGAAKMAEHISSLQEGTVIELRAPVYKIYGEDYEFLFEKIRKKGYKKMLIDGRPFDLSQKEELEENKTYDMEIVLDRFIVKPEMYIQITKSIEAAMVTLDEDIMIKIEIIEGKVPKDFYHGLACPEHHFILCEMQPFHFSFNNPDSACNTCLGTGMSHVVEPRFLVTNPEKSIMKGALHTQLFNPKNLDSYRLVLLYSYAMHYHFSLDTPWCELPKRITDIMLFGTDGEKFERLHPPMAKRRYSAVGRIDDHNGLVSDIQRWYRNYIRRTVGTESMEPSFVKETMIEKTCPECGGARLKRPRLSIKIGNKNIHELSVMQLPELVAFLKELTFDETITDVASGIINEICTRLQLLIDIGLYYLNLGRRSDSISGGEMQRIKMSTQISSELMGMLYVMDEPSIGLHARDSVKVINIMKKLRDIGNTVLVVEHDLETMRNADFFI